MSVTSTEDFKLAFNTLCDVRSILHQSTLPWHAWTNPVFSYDLTNCLPLQSTSTIKCYIMNQRVCL